MGWCRTERARAWDEFGIYLLDHPLTLGGSMFHICDDSLGCCCAQQMLPFTLVAGNVPLYFSLVLWVKMDFGGFFPPVVFYQSCLLFVLKQTWKVLSVLETVWQGRFSFSWEYKNHFFVFHFTAHDGQTWHDKEWYIVTQIKLQHCTLYWVWLIHYPFNNFSLIFDYL